MTGTKKKSGGPRKGSGRKSKFGEPTVAMRVPVSLVPAIEKIIANRSANLSTSKPS